MEFFREHRLKHQVNLAGKTELSLLWSELRDKTDGLQSFFEGVDVTPSVRASAPQLLSCILSLSVFYSTRLPCRLLVSPCRLLVSNCELDVMRDRCRCCTATCGAETWRDMGMR